MAVSEVYTGTEAVSTTEHSLTTDTAGPDADTNDGIYQCFIDVSDMVAGDELEIKLYEKARSTDSQLLVHEWVLLGPQAEPLWVSDSFILMHGWDWTVKATAGTITCNWSIRKA